LLLPPSLREWLPEDHLTWFVIDAVGELDLAAFYSAYRADGHGRAGHDPALMVALLLHRERKRPRTAPIYATATARRSGARLWRPKRTEIEKASFL
jgi:hypothetical protein